MQSLLLCALLFPTRLVRAQGVPAHCVGENLGNGQLGSCDPAAPSSPAGPANAGGGLAPMQQMQMNMALGAEQAVVNAFVGWLLSPAPKHGPTPQEIRAQQIERERQAMLAEERRRRIAEERAKYQRDHAELMANAKDITGDAELAEKDITAQPTLAGLQNSVRTIDCAMQDVYDAAARLGPQGEKFADQVRREVFDSEKGLPDGKSFSRSWDSMDAGGGKAEQMVAKLLVSRHPDGGTAIDLMYTFSRNGGKPVEGQSVVMLDRLGGLDCQQTTASAAKCMRSFNAKARKDYCPKAPSAAPDHSLTLEDAK